MVPNSPAATALVPVMLFKNNPVFLNLSGGPAIAAMLLSAQHIREPRKGARARLYWFLFLAPIFWAILVLQTE